MSGHESRSLSSNSMIRALEELESELARQHDALVSRQSRSRDNSVRADEFNNQMRRVHEQLRHLMSDSAEAAKHKRRGKSARMPGPLPGVDPDTAEQQHMQRMQQRQHLQDEIEELRNARDHYSRQARELDEEVRTIRQTMVEIQSQIKRLKKEIEKSKTQQHRDNKRGGGPRGGGPRGGGPSQPYGSSDPYYDGGWSGGDYDTYFGGGGSGQQHTSYSSTQNRAATKAAGHHTSHRALKNKTNYTKR